MPDTQRSKLFTAEALVWATEEPLHENEAQALVAEFGDAHGRALDLEVTSGTGPLKLLANRDGGTLVAPRWALRPCALLHELAHLLVHPVFPEHGTEFVNAYLAAVRAHASPAREAELRVAFERAKLILDPAKRVARAKRDAVWYARHATGTTLKVIADGPPELLVGDVGSELDDALLVGDEVVTFDRLRYVWRVAAPETQS